MSDSRPQTPDTSQFLPRTASGVGSEQATLISGSQVLSFKDTEPKKPPKDAKFWLIFISLCTCLVLSALELSSVATALPTIANAFQSSQFVWVGSAYAMASTAFLPMSGGLAQSFGRRPTMLLCIALFALGSGISGGATSMNMLIAGRAVQGLGGGGIQSLTGIILADLVSLQERGVYAGLFGLTWSFAVAIGPVVGGSLASQGQWRWLFYLNLPLCAAAALLVLILLDLPTPKGAFRDKVFGLDWIGNIIVIGSSISCTLALTWGGVTAPWNSATVLAPLIIGLLGLVVFIIYEATLATNPLVPISLMTNRTGISGYLQTFVAGVLALSIAYFFPVFFQGCKGASPVMSGVYTLGTSALAPAAIISGIIVKKTGRYRLLMWVGWIFLLVGLGLMTTLRANSPVGDAIGYSVIVGIGIGIEYATTMYPIQAPLPVTQNAPALAFMWFLRSFAGVWGVTIGSTVVQNELVKRLPSDFTSTIPNGGAGLAYALIPELPLLSATLLTQVQEAFAGGMMVMWQVLLGIAALGLLSSIPMKGLPLTSSIDEDWAIKRAPNADTSSENIGFEQA
ncbi:MFS general substrate transporter [Paxillus ammoniavirescens]|nr:MFS general substrate transporter [Paxillus ammoniavirescens]